LAWPDHHLEVAHKVARKIESGRYTAVANVLLDFSFAIEVRNVGETALACLGDIQERREDEMLHSNFFRDICNVFALRLFDVRIGSLPVVCDEEDGV
jgi:hypothetical protein